MWMVIPIMTGSVKLDGIFSLKWIHCGPKGYMLDYWGTIIFCLSHFVRDLPPLKSLIKELIENLSVERNSTFSLKWRHCGPKGDILDY